MSVQIGGRLGEERNRLGLSQEDFAALGGAAPRAYWNYEKGKVSPDADFLARICEKGVDVMYVLSGERTYFVAELKSSPYETPARALAGWIAALRLSQDDADLIMALARRLSGDQGDRTTLNIPATAENAKPPHQIERRATKPRRQADSEN